MPAYPAPRLGGGPQVWYLRRVTSKTPVKSTRSRKTLNAANLEALGPGRLAAILLQIAEDQPVVKRRLRLDLAAQAGPADLLVELDKRMDALREARGRVHWRKLKDLRRDLTVLRQMIAGPLAEGDPGAALDALLRFLALESPVVARLNDAKGEIGEVFALALDDLAAVAAAVGRGVAGLEATVFAVLEDARPGLMGPIVEAMLAALTPEGVAALRALIETETSTHRRVNAGWRAALQPLLDAQGDAHAYAATYTASEQVLPPVGARIAERFIRAGQLEAAAAALARSDPLSHGGERPKRPGDPGLAAWRRVLIDLLAAEGQEAEAQAARWAWFEQDLSVEALRAYLRRLSGFDDVVETDRAFDHALQFRPFNLALRFFTAWPSPEQAATLVMARAGEIDGLEVEVLEPAARLLESRRPLAAMLILRAMVRDVARFAQAELYERAQSWLLQAASLDAQLGEASEVEPHAAFEASIRGFRRW